MAFADPPTPQLRESGWTLPAYTMAPDCGHVKLLRAVIREDMSLSLAARLIADILRALDWACSGAAQAFLVFSRATLFPRCQA